MYDTTIIKQLMEIGLAEREAKIYYSLLQTDGATIQEIQRLSGVPRTKVYEKVENLISMGYCEVHMNGKTKLYKASPTSTVKNMALDNLKERMVETSKLFNVIEEMERANKSTNKILDVFKIIKSVNSSVDTYIDLLENAKEEVVIMSRPPYSPMNDMLLEKQDETEIACMKRGIRFRILCMVDENWWESEARETLDMQIEEGTKVRYTSDLPVKMIVVDKKRAMIGIPSLPGTSDLEFTTIKSDAPGIAEVCMMAFEMVWAEAKTNEK